MIAARYGTMEDETIRRALGLLKGMQAQIAIDLLRLEGWERYRLRELRARIDLLMAQYQAQLGAEVYRAFVQAASYGTAAVVEPLQTLGIQGVFFSPSPAQVNVMLDFSADLVKGITDEMRNAINTQIRMAALGEKAPIEAMRGITQALGVDAKAGIWARRKPPVKGVAARAETILRTEMQRAYNLSTFGQQQATAKRIEGLLKTWIATADTRTRESHLRAHQEYRRQPIPVGEPFVLRDDRGKAELMYPGDPSAPARFTINCRCTTATIHPAIGVIGSTLDGRIAAELGRREKSAAERRRAKRN